MGSPESEKPGPKSPPVQDSPIFGYVSSLSPIKPVNARPIVQAYENIDVPSPQLVFKTPIFCRPRISSLSERSQHLALAGAESLSPGYVNNTREFPESMDIMRVSSSLPMTQLISYNDNDCTGGDPSPSQSFTSPSNYVDVFLADPSENGDNSSSSPEFCVKRSTLDRENGNTSSSENQMESLKEDILRVSTHTSVDPVSEQTDDKFLSKQDASQNDSVSNEGTNGELHAANTTKYISMTAVMGLRALRVPYQTEKDHVSVSLAATSMGINEGSISERQLGPVSNNVSIYTDARNRSDSPNKHKNKLVHQQVMDHPLVSRPKACNTTQNEKGNSTASGFLCQSEENLRLQTARTDLSDELGCTQQLNPYSPQNIHTCNNHTANSVQMSCASTGNYISDDLEDGAQHQRGKRKRLQFEAAENLRVNNRDSFDNTTKASNIDLPIVPLEVVSVNVSHAESMTMSSHKQVLQSVHASASSRLLVKVDRPGQDTETHLAAPRTAGILHLNSIVNVASKNCNSNMQLLEINSSIQEEKTLAEDIHDVSKMSKNGPSSTNLIDPENLTSSSERALHYAGIKNNKETQDGNRAFHQQHSSFGYQTPLNVTPLNSSMSLKHIDRYMTPCIMKSLPSEEATKTEESTQTSPRKKRKKAPDNDGQKRCNCKRSKCLKLYCDCFAAGSFCSEACACQDCSNRPEYEETVRETRQLIESRNPLAFAPKVVMRVSDPPKSSGDNNQITPTSARHKRGCNCKKSLCLKKYCECFQAGVGCSLGCRCEGCKNAFGTKDGCGLSEIVVEHKRPNEGELERDLSGELEAIEVKRQVANPNQCHSRLSPVTPLLQSSTGNDVNKPPFSSSYFPSPDSVAYEQSGADLSSVHSGGLTEDSPGTSSFNPCDPENDYHTAGKVDVFSPGWEGFPDICNLSPLLKASPLAGGSSVLKTSERNILQMKLFQGGSRMSLGSRCLGSSPITPMPQFNGSKYLQEPDSNSGLPCNPEDDTPEILKETCSPLKSVKATSPNQKRVSPPHHVACSTSANSSPGLRSGRKYVLQSVPAFPSLTPYSKSNREGGT